MTPHYVGQARSKKGFSGETCSPRNCINYNRVIHGTKGTPIILLLARPKPKRFGFALSGKRELDFLEKMIIGMALAKNDDLINVHHTKNLKEITIPGVFGKLAGHRPLSDAQECLKSLLNV